MFKLLESTQREVIEKQLNDLSEQYGFHAVEVVDMKVRFNDWGDVRNIVCLVKVNEKPEKEWNLDEA